LYTSSSPAEMPHVMSLECHLTQPQLTKLAAYGLSTGRACTACFRYPQRLDAVSLPPKAERRCGNFIFIDAKTRISIFVICEAVRHCLLVVEVWVQSHGSQLLICGVAIEVGQNFITAAHFQFSPAIHNSVSVLRVLQACPADTL
jgi:hypothetical protein